MSPLRKLVARLRLAVWGDGAPRSGPKARIVEGVVTGLVVIALGGIVASSIRVVHDLANGVAELFDSDPSEAEVAVERLVDDVRSDPTWLAPPGVSHRGRVALERHWSRLRPDRPRPFPDRSARWWTLDQAYQEGRLDGHPLLIHAYVDQTYGTMPVRTDPDQVREGFRIATGDSDAVGWCAPASFRRGSQPATDQPVSVKALVLARGSKPSSDGAFISGVYLVCSAFSLPVPPADAAGVGDLFRSIESERLWRQTPALSEGGRQYLLYHWKALSPSMPHRFRKAGSRPMELDGVSSDRRFDDGLIAVSGHVSQVSLDTNWRYVFEDIRISEAGQEGGVWCRTARPLHHVIRMGDYVEAVGVPVARGAADLAGGGFENYTFMACAAMRRVFAGGRREGSCRMPPQRCPRRDSNPRRAA